MQGQSMIDDRVANARLQDIKSILSYYGKEFYKDNCKCILHEDNNRSAFVGRKNRLICRSCGAYLSTIDVVMHEDNITDIREASKKVLEISNTPINYNSGFLSKEPSKKEISYSDRKYFAEGKKLDILIKYLNSRGISKNILPILDKNRITYGADKLDQVHFFFTRYDYCIYRSKTQNKNFNCGEVSPICIKANKTNSWYVVEGLYDGLSLLQFNHNVIVLNSVANINKLIQKVKENNLYNLEYIIATDNDKPGIEAKKQLETFFIENNINYKSFDVLYNSKCKDVNDLVIGGLYEGKTNLI